MSNTEGRMKLPEAARRLGITMNEVLLRADRGELVLDIDRVEGRIYVPVDQLPG